MRILLDTNVLLLLGISPGQLPLELRNRLLISDELLVSSISRAEIGIKCSIGKLELPTPEKDFWEGLTGRLQVATLSFTSGHASLLATLPLHHRDPFDRMIVAQCLAEDLTLATTDSVLLRYGITMA